MSIINIPSNVNKAFRKTLGSKFDEKWDVFLDNLTDTVNALEAGKPEEGPFVRYIHVDGNLKKGSWAFFFGYAADENTQAIHAFPNRFLQAGEFIFFNTSDEAAEVADYLSQVMASEETLDALKDDLHQVWAAKVANGQKGRATASANTAVAASKAGYEGGKVLPMEVAA